MGKISDRQLAAELGISHTMVRKYRQRGMPTKSAPAALAWLTDNSIGRFADKNALPASEPEVETFGELETADEEEGDREPLAFAAIAKLEGMSQAQLTKRLTAARIRLVERDAAVRSLQERQAKMDADLRDGRLLRAEEENRKGFERAVTLRTKLLGLPAECAVQLAAITDPALVADFMRKRIKAALIEYCAAYGVTAEPN